MSFASRIVRLLLATLATLWALSAAADTAELRKLAHDYYEWRNVTFPVTASVFGDHRYDDRLTEYSPQAVSARRQHISELLAQVKAMSTEGWNRDDRVDAILFQAQLESADFFSRRLDPIATDPQTYVNECANALFTLLEKDYAPHRTRALAAAARLEKMPAMLRTARTNLTKPVKLYAQLAIQAARGGDDLYTTSLMTLADELSAGEPKDQAEFLAAYEARQQEIVDFLKQHQLITIPPYIGPFRIRQLPEAFKPTSPGGFMSPPGVYDPDPVGFFYIPTYNPKSGNFYIRAAIEDPRPILGHEGIPGHFLQISIANHVASEIRRQHGDSVFAEGWALYTEEMLSRAGLYPENSAAQGQVLRLSRYRAARIGVDVNLHTGRWTFEQAVQYFMEGGGLDREAAEGEAAGAASSPSQKISYITGKWQVMRLLGRYRDTQGDTYRLGAFHDQLLSYGTLPLSVVEWLMFDDDASLRKALQ